MLAAGSSSRLGQPKQLLQYNGSTLLQRAINSAAYVATQVFVVLGSNEGLIRRSIKEEQVTVLLNPNWDEGIGSSISYAVRSLINHSHEIESILFLVCDQPYVSKELLLDIKSLHLESGKQITACRYASTLGIPAVFNRSIFEELCNLNGDSGAKSIINRHQDQANFVDFPKGSIDIDLKEDLDYLT